MSFRFPIFLRPCLALLAAVSAAISAGAQASPAASADGPAPSRLEIYGGYGYFHPFSSDINNIPYETINFGAVGSVSGYFNRYVGLQLEGSAFPEANDDHNCVYTAQAGPVLRYPKGRLVPFFHALGGASKIGGPAQQTCSVWGWGVTGGFGVDYILPAFHNRISIRPAQGDFQYAQIDNGRLIQPAGIQGGFGEIYNFRLSAGLSARFGHMGVNGASADTTLTCSADPANAYSGDPITLSSNVTDLRPSKTTKYLWTTTGGRVSGTEAIETVNTAGLAPGTYNVQARLVQGSHEREVASCTASFTVRDFDPPSLTCSADRAAINSGDPVTITSAGMSPQNRPLTYSYTTTNGQIAGNSPSASLTTAGATPGTITVTCTATDDRGRSANATASVVIATPVPAARPAPPSALCSLSFERDRKRPDRVDNEAKACLDDVALLLNRQSDSRLVLIGNHTARETNRNAAERALNAADYLTQEKGIDRGRLDLRIAADPSRTVTTLLLPAGTSADTTAGSSFDPATVVRSGQAYGRAGVHPTTQRAARRHRRTRRRARAAASTTPN